MRIFDCFLFHDELDMLECRLTELYDVVDFFVLMEATHTHQGEPKPSYFMQHHERFAKWQPKLRYFVTDVVNSAPDAMGREQVQRDRLAAALVTCGAEPDDVVMLSDVDEIPTREIVTSYRENPPDGLCVCQQRFCCFAVDWEHPESWYGTTIDLYKNISSFATMRDLRGSSIPRILNGGWHLSWLGGPALTLSKLHSFTHPEIIGSTEPGLRENQNYLDGRHVDGTKLLPVHVDGTWPDYIYERKCPATWFRHQEWKDIWPLIDRIPGWLTEEDAQKLYDLARSEQGQLCAVEIGSYLGRSSAAIAAGLRFRNTGTGDVDRLFCVDTWEGVPGDPFYQEQLAASGVTADMEDAHQQNLDKLGLNPYIERIRDDSMMAAGDFGYPVDLRLIFIDGDHSYEGCRSDVEHWGPLLMPGGLLTFHDRTAPGVARVIAELPGWYEPVTTAGDLAVFRKKAT